MRRLLLILLMLTACFAVLPIDNASAANSGQKLILVVDGGERINRILQIIDALNATYSFGYDVIDEDYVNASLLSNYKLVIWSELGVSKAPSASSRDALAEYLSNGGNLIIFGEDIGWCLVALGYDKAWYETYLKARYVADDSRSNLVLGVSGTPYENLTINLSGSVAETSYPSVISPIGGSEAILKWGSGSYAGKGAGVRYKGDYGLVYFSFNIDATTSDDVLKKLLEIAIFDLLTWVNVEVPEITEVPEVKVNVTGYAEYNTTISIYLNESLVDSRVVSGAINYTVTLTLGNDSYYVVKVVVRAGNAYCEVKTYELYYDRYPPGISVSVENYTYLNYHDTIIVNLWDDAGLEDFIFETDDVFYCYGLQRKKQAQIDQSLANIRNSSWYDARFTVTDISGKNTTIWRRIFIHVADAYLSAPDVVRLGDTVLVNYSASSDILCDLIIEHNGKKVVQRQFKDNISSNITLVLDEPGWHNVTLYLCVNGNVTVKKTAMIYCDGYSPLIEFNVSDKALLGPYDAIEVFVDDDYGLQNVTLYLNASLIEYVELAGADNYTRTLTVQELLSYIPGEGKSGYYTIEVLAYDLFNHTSRSEVLFYIDIDAPAVTLILNNALKKTGHTLYVNVPVANITINIEDFCRIASLNITIGNETVLSLKDLTNKETFNFTLVVNGSTVVTVYASDELGNSIVETFRIVLDTISPAVRILEPKNGSAISSGGFFLAWTAFDDNEIYLVEVYLNGTLYAVLDGYARGCYVKTKANGAFIVEVRVYDSAGNMGSCVIVVNVQASEYAVVEEVQYPAVLYYALLPLIATVVAVILIFVRRKKPKEWEVSELSASE